MALRTAGIAVISILAVSTAALGQDQKSIVGIAKDANYSKAVRQAVESAGGLKGIIKKGDTVFIKPNIVAASPPGAGVVTDYRVVAEIVALAKEAGAKRIIIGEHTNPDQTDIALETSRIGEIKGVEFLDTNTGPKDSVTMKAPISLSGVAYTIPKAWMDADVVISVPILKTHDIAGATLSLKNVGIGLPPYDNYAADAGYKVKLHDIGVTKTIADVNQFRRIDFAVIDAMVAGEGSGPIGVTPVRMNTIIAGRDPVAVDTIGASVMGFEPHLISHIVYAEGVGLGTADTTRIEVKGASVQNVAKTLKRAPNNIYPYKMTTYAKGMPKGFVQDGELGEWATSHMGRINSLWQVTEGKSDWKGTADSSAAFSMGYEDGKLMVAGNVTDDEQIEGVDGFTLHFSFKNPFEPDKSKSRKKPNPKKDFNISATLPKTGTKAAVTASDSLTSDSLAIKGTDKGYTFELMVDLQSRDLNLSPSEEFWVDLELKDTDGTNPGDSTLFWAGPGNKATDLTTLGRAILIRN